jgi:radical SAM protein with 4Fe4S-binding SPASM domain
MSHSELYYQVLSDTDALLREQEVAAKKGALRVLSEQCLADPMKLYPRASFRPRYVVWELTLRCNLRCAHCGSNAGTTRGRELTPEEALHLSNELGALGTERVTLLGGEPLLREDWEAITASLQRAGVRVNIISNGWLTSDRDLVRRIRDAGLTTFALSVDGWGKRHDELRRREGSWARILESFAHASAVGGLSTGAVTTVTRLCMDHLEDLYQMLVDHGVRLWQLQVCTPQGRISRNDPLLPTADDLLRLADFILQKKAERKLRIDPADSVGYFGRWETDADFRSDMRGNPCFWRGCQAGCQVLGIDANGDIKGCLSLPSSERRFIEGNLREETLEAIWNKPGAFAYNREFRLDLLSGFCAECEYRGLCRAGCVSHAFCTSGDRGQNPNCLHRLSVERGAGTAEEDGFGEARGGVAVEPGE